MNYAGRLAKLREKMAEHDLDGFLVGCPVEDIFHISGANRRYLSGFTGSTGWLLITADKPYIATDFRYFEQVEQECPHFTLFPTVGGVDKWFPGLIGEAGLSAKRIGFEPGDMSVASLNAIRKAIDTLPEIRPAEATVGAAAWSLSYGRTRSRRRSRHSSGRSISATRRSCTSPQRMEPG